MDLCDDLEQAELQKIIDLLQASINEDFKKQTRDREVSSPYFRDVGSVMPGFTNGLDMGSIRVRVDPSLFKR